jgi:hypothetical protein
MMFNMQPKNFITTYKKHRFSPLEPVPEDIDVGDVAHALSLMCRANGHFSRFFSVARHCVNCCREGQARGECPRTQLILLLHDAGEAYISDITRPVKMGLPDYIKIEERLQRVIWEKFGITPADADFKTVGEIDDLMLKLEFARFAGENIEIDVPPAVSKPNFEPAPFEADEKEYLDLFYSLISQI